MKSFLLVFSYAVFAMQLIFAKNATINSSTVFPDPPHEPFLKYGRIRSEFFATTEEIAKWLKQEGFPDCVTRVVLLSHLKRQIAVQNYRTLQFREYWKFEFSNIYGYNYYTYKDQVIHGTFRNQKLEQYRMLRALIGDAADAYLPSISLARKRAYGNLSEEKIIQIEAINDDYVRLVELLNEDVRRITLSGDKARFIALETERQQLLKGLLDPTEFEDYELRSSDTAKKLRQELWAMNLTRSEYCALFKIRQAFDLANIGIKISDDELNRQKIVLAQTALTTVRAEEFKSKTLYDGFVYWMTLGKQLEKQGGTDNFNEKVHDLIKNRSLYNFAVDGSKSGKLWNQLRTNDIRSLKEDLQNNGFPISITIAIILELLREQHLHTCYAAAQITHDTPFWLASGHFDDQTLLANFAVRVESLKYFGQQTKELLGGPVFPDFSEDAYNERKLRSTGALPYDKDTMLYEINNYYKNMSQVPGKDWSRKYNDENDAIKSILTDVEFQNYQLQNDSRLWEIRRDMRYMDLTEEEFNKLRVAYDSFMDKKITDSFSWKDYSNLKDFNLKEAIGEKRFEDYRVSIGAQYESLYEIAGRLNIPFGRAREVAYALDNVIKRAQKVAFDWSLTKSERKEKLSEITLPLEVKETIYKILGGEGMVAYEKEFAQWLERLQNYVQPGEPGQ